MTAPVTPNPFGRFDDAAREYVITRPDTPLPWINYLGQDDLFGLCTNTAGGYTFWRDASSAGEAKNSWLTGAAAWTFVAISQGILGIRPENEGLRVDPCIPRGWKTFTVDRVYRGKKIRIVVNNPTGAQKGVKRILLNGQSIAGNLIPLDLLESDNEARVML